jgi:hypothetical protein
MTTETILYLIALSVVWGLYCGWNAYRENNRRRRASCPGECSHPAREERR